MSLNSPSKKGYFFLFLELISFNFHKFRGTFQLKIRLYNRAVNL